MWKYITFLSRGLHTLRDSISKVINTNVFILSLIGEIKCYVLLIDENLIYNTKRFCGPQRPKSFFKINLLWQA